MVTTPELIAIRRGQIRQLIVAGLTAPEIARQLNERRTIVASDIKAIGITPAKVTRKPRDQARNDALAIQIRELGAQGIRRSTIAKTLAISDEFLRKLMADYGIPIPVRAPEHGTLKEYRTYSCRCSPCTAANTAEIARARAARKARLSPDSPVHGTASGYNNHLCRCYPCTTAAAQFYADYRTTPPERIKRSWTFEEDNAILDYTYTVKEHAARLNRTAPSINSRRALLLKKGAVARKPERITTETVEAKQARAAAAEKKRSEAAARTRAAEAELKRIEVAAVMEQARAAILTAGRRDSVRALVLQGMSRADIMATMQIDYETLRADLEHLNLSSPQRRFNHGAGHGRVAQHSGLRPNRSALVSR